MSHKSEKSRVLRIIDNNIKSEKTKENIIKKKENIKEKPKKTTETATRTQLENLAEERRLALGEALKENKKLHETLNKLQEEIIELKALAVRAELLEELAKELLQSNEETCAENDDNYSG